MSSRKVREANLLGAAALAIVDRIESTLDADTRGFSAAAALIRTSRRPGQTVDFLARVVGLTHSGAVRLVDRLEADGLVERRAGTNRRSLALHLTAAGEQAASIALARREQALIEVLDVLDDDQQESLLPLLERLLDALTPGRWEARHLCRLCDYPRCSQPACPVDEAASRAELS